MTKVPDLKLRYSLASPYARKVRVVAHELGLALTLIATDTWHVPPELLAENPLGKVPSLLIDGMRVLYDSPVICEYLIAEARGWQLLPQTGAQRFEILKQQALGDGLMDLAVEIFAERNFRPEEMRSEDWIARQSARILTGLDHIEERPESMAGEPTLGTIAIACALGYLDLRLPELAWRIGRPSLEAFEARHAARPSFIATVPQGVNRP